MTAFIIDVVRGDTERGAIEYQSAFAVGLWLFVFTLVINLLAQALLAKFREVYE